MMIFTLPKPLPDSDRVFSWLIVWGGALPGAVLSDT